MCVKVVLEQGLEGITAECCCSAFTAERIWPVLLLLSLLSQVLAAGAQGWHPRGLHGEHARATGWHQQGC